MRAGEVLERVNGIMRLREIQQAERRAFLVEWENRHGDTGGYLGRLGDKPRGTMPTTTRDEILTRLGFDEISNLFRLRGRVEAIKRRLELRRSILEPKRTEPAEDKPTIKRQSGK